MPAKAQMFSVRLPSLSTRHEGPPGPRGQASHAAGTRPIRGREVVLSRAHSRFKPTGFSTAQACLFTKPPTLRPACRHRASPKTQAHPGTRLRTLTRQLQHFSRASANKQHLGAQPRTHPRARRPGTHRRLQSQPADPAAQAHPRPTHAGARVPGNSRASRADSCSCVS